MKKSKILELLINAQFQPNKDTGALCRGSASLGTGCNKCDRCVWEKKRQKALTDHL